MWVVLLSSQENQFVVVVAEVAGASQGPNRRFLRFVTYLRSQSVRSPAMGHWGTCPSSTLQCAVHCAVLLKRIVWAMVGKIFVLTRASNGDSATVTASCRAGSGKPDVVSASFLNADGRTEPPAGAASLRGRPVRILYFRFRHYFRFRCDFYSRSSGRVAQNLSRGIWWMNLRCGHYFWPYVYQSGPKIVCFEHKACSKNLKVCSTIL